jgi:hypothetical protein
MIDRFKHSASPRIDALMQDNNANAEVVTMRLIAIMVSNTNMYHTTITCLLSIMDQLGNLTQLTEKNAHMNEELLMAHGESRTKTTMLRDIVTNLM